MKTQVRWKSLPLQSFQVAPTTLVPLLEAHFRLKWPQLTALSLSLWPPVVVGQTMQQLRESCTEPNGTVWGIRFFDVLPPGFLVSPTSKWVWETAEQIVPSFSNAQAVRGHHGFHAAWTDLGDWLGSTVDHHSTTCKALVLGHGDIILGDVGWRSSKMTVVRAATSSEELSNLRQRYPSVIFQEHTEQFVSAIMFEFPHDIRKIERWLREKSLSAMKDEFA